MKYARITPDGLLESAIFFDKEVEQGYANGFKPLTWDQTKPNVSGLQGIEPHYHESDTDIVASYVVVENHPKTVNAEIKRLQTQLSAEDYKVTKCQECALMGEPMPYDIEVLHSERKTIRMRINELQTLIE